MVENNLITETPNYILIKESNIEMLCIKIGNKYKRVFESDISAINYFKRIDIKEFLELPNDVFIDVLDSQGIRTANTFYDIDYGISVYSCFENNFKADIFKLLQYLTGVFSQTYILEFLLEITNSNIKNSSEISNSELILDNRDFELFIYEYKSEHIKINYPHLYHYISKYFIEIENILESMFTYKYFIEETNEMKYLNYTTVENMTNIINGKLDIEISQNKFWDILNILVVTEIVTKCDIEDMPQKLINNIINKQIIDTNKIRVSNVYFTNFDLNNANNISKIMKDNNVTIRSLSFDLIYRIFSLDKAKKDFPQAYSKLGNHQFIEMSKEDNNSTKKSVDFEKDATDILLRFINKYGYIYEDSLIKKLSRKHKKSIKTTTEFYSKVRSDIMVKNNLCRERQTIELYKKFNIKKPYTTKTIVYKKESN